MITCTLMDIHSKSKCAETTTLEDVNVKLVAQFESSDGGEVLINQPKGIAVAAEGHVFNSLTKTNLANEVIQRYVLNGIEGILSMNGQYTVIIYDCCQHKLIALTDTLSKSSLFYEQPDFATNRLSISNTLSWFKKTKDKSNLDLVYMIAYLSVRPKPVGRTPYRDVQRLPLSTGLTFESRKNRLKLWEYWWPFPQKTELSVDLCIHRLNEIMTEVVKEYITCYQDSIGVLLSGGLDSAYVYAVTARFSQKPPLAFHYSFQIPECNELEWAQAVVDHYGGELVCMDFGKIWTFQEFPNIPTSDEPIRWTFNSKKIIDQATEPHGIRLMLDGLGGDDFFDAPPNILFSDQLDWKHPIRTLKKLNRRVKNDGVSYMDAIRQATLNPGIALPILPEYIPPSLTIYDKPLHRFRGNCRVQKHIEQRIRYSRPSIGLPASHISHSPLFDPRIIEVASALPSHMRRTSKETKVALRRAALSYLPERVVNRKKENPHTPILLQGLHREWPVISHYFQHDTKLYDLGLIDRDKFITALQTFRGGNTKLAQYIIYAFACEAWLSKQ